MTFLGLSQTFVSVGVFSPAIDSFILPRLEAPAMGITVAITAERDQIVVGVVTQPAS